MTALLLLLLSAPSASPVCDAALWQHVYNPARLRVIEPCVAVSGTVERAVREADGDFHVWLKVDPQFKRLLSKGNRAHQKGHLVVEPMCEGRVTQADAAESKVCAGFSQEVFSRRMLRKHVVVVGAYVDDLEHNWREVHPITSIEVR